MAELVTHEGQVTVTTCSQCHKTYHLMKSHTSVHNRRLRFLVHRSVHFRVHQTESDGLVAHHSLVMTFRIADGLFILTLIGELPPYFTYTPVIVRQFLDPLDPVISHTHAHTEVESDTALLDRSCKACHTADILGDGECFFIHLMDKYIGKCQISYSIIVDALIEVVLISDKGLLQAMIPIQHTGHSVETETVYMILLHPVLAVGQKEIFCLILTIIEAA